MMKICVQAFKCESWPYKTLTGLIATFEIMIHYTLSKLTISDKLFKCFHTSRILFYQTRLYDATFKKSGIYDRSK